MFQFTTTNVINDATGLTAGLHKDEEGLRIKRIGKFLKANVTEVAKKEAASGNMFSVEVDLTKLVTGNEETTAKAGETYRLMLHVGLTEGSTHSAYANDSAYKGKAFSVDFVWGADATATATALVKSINKYMVMVYGDKLVTVTDGGSGKLTLTGTSEYQVVKSVVVEKFDATAYHGMGEYKVVLEDGKGITITPSKESFGSYSWLLHNLRLPTSARTGAFALNQDESPIPGGMYDQYTIHYCVNRGPLGMNAVGDEVKSSTVHVLYVLQGCKDYKALTDAIMGLAPAEGTEQTDL